MELKRSHEIPYSIGLAIQEQRHEAVLVAFSEGSLDNFEVIGDVGHLEFCCGLVGVLEAGKWYCAAVNNVVDGC